MGGGFAVVVFVWCHKNIELRLFIVSGRCFLCRDVNGDGALDIVAAQVSDVPTGNRIVLYLSDGAPQPSWRECLIVDKFGGGPAGSPFFTQLSDVDQDGDLDVLATGGSGVTVFAWFESDGDRTLPGFTFHVFDTRGSVNDDPRWMTASDLDGDGDVDYATSGASKVGWYEQLDGTSPPEFAFHVVAAANNVRAVIVADLNGDAFPDLVSASILDNLLAWYPSDAGSVLPPTFPRRIAIDAAVSGARSVYAYDIDGDGDTDLALACEYANTVSWYENSGVGESFTPHVLSSSTMYAFDVIVLAPGGVVSLASASQNDGKVRVFSNNGTASAPTFDEAVVLSVPVRAMKVNSGDLDNDGKVDLVAGIDTGVKLLRNTGCAPGTYSVNGNGSEPCAGCPAGRHGAAWLATSASDCEPCALGRWSAAGASACLPCPVGTYGNASALSTSGCSGLCVPAPGAVCSAGAVAANGTLCPLGSFSNASGSLCQPCAAGRFGNTAGVTTSACSGPCAAGTCLQGLFCSAKRGETRW